MRPRLMLERAMDDEVPWDSIPFMGGEFEGLCRFPHCDCRILHLPEECKHCAMATWLQEERAALGVSNTGQANREWPCPADRARGSASYDAWPGNRRSV